MFDDYHYAFICFGALTFKRQNNNEMSNCIFLWLIDLRKKNYLNLKSSSRLGEI